MRAVDHCGLQLQLAAGAHLIEQHLMQLRPDPGLGPVPQPPPAGDTRAAQLLSRHLSPGASGHQDANDAGQSSAVITRQAPGVAEATRWTLRQQQLDPLPQPVGHQLCDPLQHHLIGRAIKIATALAVPQLIVKSVVWATP